MFRMFRADTSDRIKETNRDDDMKAHVGDKGTVMGRER